eukprot:TRINITY_DN17159_c0_g1_i1.p1 TRINITY_DN17159_c0_g1~~TRINITY_DN17159_c0_g1_i1.p1  ORF type:complete len:259 (-),score=51.84 TRINITY_DN17159_c0_g1_i1:6-782(-)
MKVVQVPVLSDNYSYLVIDEKSKKAAAVDPAEADKVIQAAEKLGVRITTVLTTHHHWDHSGGNEDIVSKLKDLSVLGGDDRIPKLTKKVKHGDEITLESLKIKVFFTPCHTSGHVLYFIEADGGDQHPALFSGDTLFIGGCGRFFEGTAKQMHYALLDVVANLPKQTEVYCGHEYTVKNLQFAMTVEPDNPDLKAKLEWAKKQREKGESTVPSTVEEELRFNPFMRVNQPSIKKNLGLPEDADAIQVMASLRAAKDKF